MLIPVLSLMQPSTLVVLLSGIVAGMAAGWVLSRWSNSGPLVGAFGRQIPGRESADSPEAVGREYEQEVLMRMHEAGTSIAEQVREYEGTLKSATDSLEQAAKGPRKKRADAAAQVVSKIIEVNAELLQRLTPAMRKIEEHALEIEAQMADALIDSLTGIPNRRAFDQELWRRFAEWKRQHTAFSVMLIDTDHFHKLYTQHGGEGGDDFLKQVAQAISKTLRDMDLVARFSPGALAAILPATDLSEAIKTAERVRAALAENRFERDGASHQITISIGLAESVHGDNAASLLRRSDAALYAAKEAGRNRVFVSTGESCEPGAQALIRQRQRPQSESAGAAKEGDSLWLPATGSQVEQPPCFASTTDPRIDALTGLPNRQSFSEALRPRLAEWRRHKMPLSLMLVEIDDLNRLSDRFGKEAHDLALRAVPQFLTAAVRETDLISRFDEGKFAVLLAQNDVTAATTVAERIRTAIASCDTLRIRDKSIRFTSSIGVAEAAGEDGSVALIMRAEAALRAARNAGSNQTFVHKGVNCLSTGSADAVDASEELVRAESPDGDRTSHSTH